MKIIKTASGKNHIRISRKEWEKIGRTAGWLGDAKKKVGGLFKGLFQNGKTKFISKGIQILQDISYQSQNAQEQQALNIAISQLNQALDSDIDTLASTIKDIHKQLQDASPQPMNATAGKAVRTPAMQRARRKVSPPSRLNDGDEMFKGIGVQFSAYGKAGKETYEKAEEVGNKTNNQLSNLANQKIGGYSGAEIVSGIDVAIGVLASLGGWLQGISEVMSQFSNIVSQYEVA